MRLNNFWFAVLLFLCPFIFIAAIKLAYLERGYFAYGGECFVVFLPSLLFIWRNWSIKKEWEDKEKMKEMR